MMSTSATTSGRGLGPPGDDRAGSAPPLQGALGPGTSPSRCLTDPAAPCRHPGTHEHQSGLLGTGSGGYPTPGKRSATARADSLVGGRPRRASWNSWSSSSLSSSYWQSPVDHCWPCATLQRLTSSPQEPIQRTSRARSQTPARAPPRRPHPGTPKTNRRRLGHPPPLPAWRVTTLRTGRSSGSWAATGNPPRVGSRPWVCPGAAGLPQQPNRPAVAAVPHGRDPDPAPPCSSARGR